MGPLTYISSITFVGFVSATWDHGSVDGALELATKHIVITFRHHGTVVILQIPPNETHECQFFMMNSVVEHMGTNLLNGCCHEAERAQRVGLELEGLRNSLPETFHPHLTGVIDEIYKTSQLLRDLADKSQVHMSRVPTVMDYLNVVLPCLSRSLRDINKFIEDRSITKERRWRKMYNDMSRELPGTSLSARFIMYNQFLCCLQFLLTKSPNFDLNALEIFRNRILQLRDVRGISAPTPIQQELVVRRSEAPIGFWEETNSHWAESIFSRPLPTRTELKKPGPAMLSQAYGPLHRLGHLKIAADAKILVKRSFSNDRLSVIFFLQIFDDAPYLLIRTFQTGQPWVAVLGAHELCIHQDTNSSLTLTRWSQSEDRIKPWAVLSFVTWEELILFHCTFVALKARSPSTVNVNPKDFHLRSQRKEFQAQIIDDDFQHVLKVYRDEHTGRYRLHTAVWEGVMRYCPVWTAFLPEKIMATGSSWIMRKSRHKIWVRDIQPYVFCEKYRAQNQRRGKYQGFFELYFVHEQAASRFKELFEPSPEPTIAASSSDESTADQSGQ